jgi:hypothetical protein
MTRNDSTACRLVSVKGLVQGPKRTVFCPHKDRVPDLLDTTGYMHAVSGKWSTHLNSQNAYRETVFYKFHEHGETLQRDVGVSENQLDCSTFSETQLQLIRGETQLVITPQGSGARPVACGLNWR